MIAVLAALLAIAETGGKSAQTNALAQNIEAANLWSFFQAKTIRQTMLRAMGETIEATALPDGTPAQIERLRQRLDGWKATIDRWETEPPTGEGRRELIARAKAAEEKRDRSTAAYHQFEHASAALQLAIVLASASVVTGVAMLVFVAGGLGAIGCGFAMLGWLAPTLLHL